MKRVKNIIFILALCVQFIAIKPVQPTQADFKLLKKALNAKINKNKNFIASKTEDELAHIVFLSEQALSDSAILQRYAIELSLSPSQLKSVIIELAQKSAATPKKNKTKKVAPSLKKSKAKKIVTSLKSPDPIVTSAILKKTINATLHKNPNFYLVKSKKELNNIIKQANQVLNNQKAIIYYQNTLGSSISDTTDLFKSIVASASKALPRKSKRRKAKKAAPPLKSPDPIVTSAIVKKTITIHKEPNCYQVKSKNKESIQKQSSHYSLYIMLDVPKRNSQEETIDWQNTIDCLKTQIRNTQFTVDTNRHITLAWAESKMPFTKNFLKKVKNAISRAHEILKIVYKAGIPGISFLDGGLILGKKKNVIAFQVAKSKGIKIMQEILLQFIEFEGIDIFNTFTKSSLLHVTLGRIVKSKPSNLKKVVKSLLPPQASRKSQGKNLRSNIFRASYTSGYKEYHQLGQYAF